MSSAEATSTSLNYPLGIEGVRSWWNGRSPAGDRTWNSSATAFGTSPLRWRRKNSRAIQTQVLLGLWEADRLRRTRALHSWPRLYPSALRALGRFLL